jgi:hypothetical protein
MLFKKHVQNSYNLNNKNFLKIHKKCLTNFEKFLYYNCLKLSLRLSKTPSKKLGILKIYKLMQGSIVF